MKELIISFLPIFSSFSTSYFIEPPPKYEIISNRIVAESSRKISEKYKLKYIGNGASMMEDIKMLALSFTSDQCDYVENIRSLVVNSVNLFLQDINSNEEIRPYLHNYPFTANNIELTIYFRDNNCKRPSSPLIAYVSAENGSIDYCIDKNDRYIDYHKETFEEAEKILNEKSKLKNVATNP